MNNVTEITHDSESRYKFDTRASVSGRELPDVRPILQHFISVSAIPDVEVHGDYGIDTKTFADILVCLEPAVVKRHPFRVRVPGPCPNDFDLSELSIWSPRIDEPGFTTCLRNQLPLLDSIVDGLFDSLVPLRIRAEITRAFVLRVKNLAESQTCR